MQAPQVPIQGINDLETLRLDLAELQQHPEEFASEIKECSAEIARLEALLDGSAS